MSLQLIARKSGMMSFFSKEGAIIPVTVLELAPNVVSQIKTNEKDSYQAIQLASISVKPSKKKRLKKPVIGHYESKKIAPKKYCQESRVDSVDGFEVGQELAVDYFEADSLVDVTAMSKGKGYQGVMKRYGAAGGPASHGSSKFHRRPGSTGNRTTPGRCLPGRMQAGHMGAKKVTAERLKIVSIDTKRNVILVQGSVPGANGSKVAIRKSRKQRKN